MADEKSGGPAPADIAPKAEAIPTAGPSGPDAQPKGFNVARLKALLGRSNMKPEDGLRSIKADTIRATGDNPLPTTENPIVIQQDQQGQSDPEAAQRTGLKDKLKSFFGPASTPDSFNNVPLKGPVESNAVPGAQAETPAQTRSFDDEIADLNSGNLPPAPEDPTRNGQAETPAQTRSFDDEVADLNNGNLPPAPEDPTRNGPAPVDNQAAMRQAYGLDGKRSTDTQPTIRSNFVPPTEPTAEAPPAAAEPTVDAPAKADATVDTKAEQTKTPEQAAAERRLNLAKAGAKLEQLGADLEDPAVQDLLKDIEDDPDKLALVEETYKATEAAKADTDKVEDRMQKTGLSEEQVKNMLANGEIKQLLEMVSAGMKAAEDKGTKSEADQKWFDKLKWWQKMLLVIAAAGVGTAAVTVAGGAHMAGTSTGSRQ